MDKKDNSGALTRHIIILGDGMADEPCAILGGRTPLEAAETPALDALAAAGRSGLLQTVPDGFSPGSEIAHLSILGYNLNEVFEGRGALEAESIGVGLAPGEMAMRCNLICISPDGFIKNHSAGHISTAEAAKLIADLDNQLGDGRVSFHTGIGYRHLLKIKGADKRIACTPPHDVFGKYAEPLMPKPLVPEAKETASLVVKLIKESQKILGHHPVNLLRIAEGKDPANSIWPWGPGYKPCMKTLAELFGIMSGVVISAVDLIRGIGIYAGLKPVIVEGATGLYDTDYEGKLNATLDALRNGADFVFLHIEASDEAGHEGDAMLKKQTIENLDSRIVAPLVKSLADSDEDVAVAVLPDHPTPCSIRVHTSAPVPFTIWRRGATPDRVTSFSEAAARNGCYGLLSGDRFIREFLTKQHTC